MPDEETRQDGADVRPLAASIARRDRWRVRLWAAVTGGRHALLTGCELNEQAREDFAAAIIDWFWALLWWPVTLVVAAVVTIWFTLASRRATLRQIQAGLADISAQLASMTAGP